MPPWLEPPQGFDATTFRGHYPLKASDLDLAAPLDNASGALGLDIDATLAVTNGALGAPALENIPTGKAFTGYPLGAADVSLAAPLASSGGAVGLDYAAPFDLAGGALAIDIDATLQVASGALGLNLGHGNAWTVLQTFAAGITGTGSVGTLTVPWGNLTSVPSLVNTFNGRSGTVLPASGDYTAAEVTDAASTAAANTFADLQTFSAGVDATWLHATTAPPSSPSQGAYVAWNMSAGTGETDLLNQPGDGTGGWVWRQWSGTAWVQAASLSPAGALALVAGITATTGSFSGGLTSSDLVENSGAGFLANAGTGGIYETRYGAAWVGRMYASDAENLRLATYNGTAWIDQLALAVNGGATFSATVTANAGIVANGANGTNGGDGTSSLIIGIEGNINGATAFSPTTGFGWIGFNLSGGGAEIDLISEAYGSGYALQVRTLTGTSAPYGISASLFSVARDGTVSTSGGTVGSTGVKPYTADGSFTVPAGSSWVFIEAWGAGGGGGGGSSSYAGGAGGGGGYAAGFYAIPAGTVLTITVPSGGAAGGPGGGGTGGSNTTVTWSGGSLTAQGGGAGGAGATSAPGGGGGTGTARIIQAGGSGTQNNGGTSGGDGGDGGGDGGAGGSGGLAGASGKDGAVPGGGGGAGGTSSSGGSGAAGYVNIYWG